ncbi:hypothetical protein [Thermoanaerobacterium thermosaccharolyticum]|uniref:hypothetical protein n=1 Tax=Thermoanaerobacterium thermosaccharolyticum TaxID=1517 RepID=UPI0012391797|nr:hypothetical protein [Thermoanaerobacterium thermosaccharolyticum]KAA5805958.1 hypothetical protein F1655_11795 [Thermoanaerobacterium thermosaccharolyticum]KAA5806504.1 hypothetical protein F1655_08510 [Thermoanaerobacterium thermosaccharolyticum]
MAKKKKAVPSEEVKRIFEEIEKLSDDDFNILKDMVDEKWFDEHFKFDEEEFKKLMDGLNKDIDFNSES